MKMIRILAALIVLACAPALAQVTPGSGPLPISKGGTNATTAIAARAALGVSIGSAVQAWDADLDALAALGGTNTIYYRSSANTWSAVTIGSLLSFSGGTLNVGDAELSAIAGLTSAADKCFYFTGAGTAATYDCPSWVRTVISAANVSAGRAAFGLAIGTDVQAYDAELAALAGLTSANNKCFYWTGTASAATFDCSSYGRGLINAADAAAARTTLGSAIGTNVQAWDSDLDAVAGLASNGMVARTGSGTAAARAITAPAAGVTISNGDGVSGNPTLALANDLAALEGLSATGFAARTGTDTWAQRAITGTSNEVCVINGDGVSGNPALGICSGWLSTAHSWSGQQTFASPIFTGSTDVQGALVLSGDITPSQITSDQNDYAPAGFSTASTLRLSSDASRNITGLAGGADGRAVVLHNVGTQNIVLTNQDLGSVAANRFLFGGDVTLSADASLSVRYDSTTQRWRALSPTSGGGGGSGVSGVTIAAGDGVRVDGTCNITTSGTCTISQSDSERVNTALDRIYQSKALGSPRRVINSWADGFKSASGINAGASSNYTLDTANGRVFPAGAIDANTIVLYHFDASATSDSSGNSNNATATGSPTVSSTNAKFSNALQLSSGKYVQLPAAGALNVGTGNFSADFWISPSSISGIINVFTTSASTKADGVYIRNNKISYFVDGGGFTDGTTTLSTGTLYHVELSRSGTSLVVYLNGSPEVSLTNGQSFNFGSWWIGHGNFNTDFAGSVDEFRFSNIVRHTAGFSPPTAAYGTIQNMTLITTSQTTDASVSNARVQIEFDDAATPTLDTDLTVEVTCNGGTNWHAGALLPTGKLTGQDGRRVSETPDTACTSGTSFAARIKTLTGKNVPIHGVSVAVH